MDLGQDVLMPSSSMHKKMSTKHKLSLMADVLANLSLPIWCIFYRAGYPLFLLLMLISLFVLYKLNRQVGRKKWEAILLGASQIAATVCAHLLFGWLWDQYIYLGQTDYETVFVSQSLTIIGALIAFLLLWRNLQTAE